MKKYMKPIMESENFVANEYVAACWTITCTNSDNSCGELKVYGETSPTVDGSLDYNSDGLGSYVGQIGTTSPGCRTKSSISPKDYGFNGILDSGDFGRFLRWLWDALFGSTNNEEISYFHPVEVTIGHPNHPNASV